MVQGHSEYASAGVRLHPFADVPDCRADIRHKRDKDQDYIMLAAPVRSAAANVGQ